MSVVQAQKRYLADKKPFFKHFYPRDIAITATRCVATQGLLVFNSYIESLDLEASDDEDSTSTEEEDAKKDLNGIDEFEWPSSTEFAQASGKQFIKALGTSTYVRSLEEIALRYCDIRIVAKLIKDVSKSAVRKYARTGSRFTAAFYMVRTGMRASLLNHLALFLIEETQQVIVILYEKYLEPYAVQKGWLETSKSKKIAEMEKDQPTFAFLTTRNAMRSSLGVVLGGLGAGVGTMLRPGFGTVIGATLGDSAAYLIDVPASMAPPAAKR